MIASTPVKLNEKYYRISGYAGVDQGFFFPMYCAANNTSYATYDDDMVRTCASCRETTAGFIYEQTKWLGFRFVGLNPAMLDELFTYVEETLGLQDRTVIHPTNLKDAYLVEMPKWWLKNALRQSVLTLLIRMGAVYYKGDMEQAISDYLLARSSREGIKAFLEGNTCLKPGVNIGMGFVSLVEGRDADYIRMVMVPELVPA